MKELKVTSQFKKDLKRYQNQPKKIEKLKVVLGYLQNDIAIPQEYKPHKLLGNYKDCIKNSCICNSNKFPLENNFTIPDIIKLKNGC